MGAFRFKFTLCDKPKQALIAILCGHFMAEGMRGHGELEAVMSRMATLMIHPEVERISKNCGHMVNLRPTRVVCKKTREKNSEIR